MDTCIVSGLATEDLVPEEQHAVYKILRLHKEQKLRLVTSSVVKEEIDAIPEHARAKHDVIYNLLSGVPGVRFAWTDSGLTLLGVGGGRREDPLYREVKGILPDEPDAQHLFQAIKSGADYFVTTDKRTILRFADTVKSKYDIQLVTPSTLLKLFSQ